MEFFRFCDISPPPLGDRSIGDPWCWPRWNNKNLIRRGRKNFLEVVDFVHEHRGD